ncbi:hypothetical protein Syun_009770 [Stephania yunnanensis]|uniref:Uncharacterized protein n=1 Tax=Stephania yunnanensis TaxID=152371 RepID=A0AAP0KF36_9MAGN
MEQSLWRLLLQQVCCCCSKYVVAAASKGPCLRTIFKDHGLALRQTYRAIRELEDKEQWACG